jgi:hypothetical protein
VTAEVKATLRGIAGVLAAIACRLVLAAPAAAHGGVTGVQDLVQDYGVLVFLVAIVLVGAGVVTWVALSPEPQPDESQGEAASPDQGVSKVAPAPEWAPTPAQAVPTGSEKESA